ncbi:zinc finger SWIM domain-containing protein 1 [Latimeria chalumnae]|nr:PREDICTED: zinc finger SWIM domain-containing protein 1 [Latimeria chalumnae]XP_005986769.1 PREDICTED: zinc finger SWIM domain-containing protein 1 [Latimeria chalumnae]XP_005986770.1 PREDICTED: zinc finger SWIM domain-containing protein 1 [Latimeria chalumnae]XP_005986771.1 PREDICTED: zinc finger SWIM domain-containing protein 1 [Latimeria chalumnae]XP_014342389.1 PREDICTED: zinc finger SWIM domain-containing protein 1 [Latimeria chalumnae]XP_014342395.1 PREDICTED: zinc finger SWIM domain-|eukprot:XP_005986768.1 PREDICTED: zinc finger SWIM domain-containing protein 1 [Latimeria chalumnae]
MALSVLNDMLNFDNGSMVSFDLNGRYELDSLSFQTKTMRSFFAKHPETLFVHRTHNPSGKVLYTFFLEGRESGGENEKEDGVDVNIVHFAVPRDEGLDSLSQMCKRFKEMNPEWVRIKTIFVDNTFQGAAAFLREFMAEVMLSVFHMAKFVQQKIRMMNIGFTRESLLLTALRNAMYTATEANLETLHRLLKAFSHWDFFQYLNNNWFTNKKIWDWYRKKNYTACVKHFQGLEAVVQKTDNFFSKKVALEMSIFDLVKDIHANGFNQTSESGDTMKASVENSAEKSKTCEIKTSNVSAQAELDDTGPSTSKDLSPVHGGKPKPSNPMEQKQDDMEIEDKIKKSLVDTCIEPASELCFSELAISQKSVQLMSTNDNDINIQILEDTHHVDKKGLKSCSCHFNQAYGLPCRHIFAVLNADRKGLRKEMIPEHWQKRSDLPSHSNDGLLDVLRSSGDNSEKLLRIKALTKQISRLLAQCNSMEFQHRYSTLRELADNWIGPYLQVKL